MVSSAGSKARKAVNANLFATTMRAFRAALAGGSGEWGQEHHEQCKNIMSNG